jgi:hypothetical protein
LPYPACREKTLSAQGVPGTLASALTRTTSVITPAYVNNAARHCQSK